jgi:hypothetical protein
MQEPSSAQYRYDGFPETADLREDREDSMND